MKSARHSSLSKQFAKLNRNDKIGWYLRRLLSMSPGEISHRVRQQLLVEVDRRQLSKYLPPTSSSVKATAWRSFCEEQECIFFFSWQQRNQLTAFWQEHFAHERAATLHLAQQILEHRLTLFGHEVQLGADIAWQQDPLSGRDWPALFWADIDTRDGKTVGGVKWVWELNRHHHIVTLAKAFFLSGDERFAAEVCRQLVSWITTNPPGQGVNWTSPLEMALRLINWAWVLAFVRQSPALTEAIFNTITESISSQAHQIARYLSNHSSANNHVIGEGAGLAVAGICCPWLDGADQYGARRGLETLTREIARQIHPDGVPAEQATQYLAFVLDFYLLVWRLLELNDATVPEIWRERLGAASDFLQHLMAEDGSVPALGDSDDAAVVRLDDRDESNNFRSILATAASLLGRADLKRAAGIWDEKSQWLLGDEGRAIFERLPTAEAPLGSKLFAQGGYCVMRDQDTIAGFDCGPLGYLSTAAHGHADALSITAVAGNTAILIDPGTYAYQEGGNWRTFFRGTSAHNTIVVDHEAQSEMQGAFLWGERANAQLLQWKSTPQLDLAVAQHDGYAGRGVIHRRTVIFDKPDWLFVVDRLLGTTRHHIEQVWHFPAGAIIQQRGELYQLMIGGKSFAIVPVEIPEIDVKPYHGLESPIQGWVSTHYAHLAAAPVLSFEGDLQLPVTMISAILLTPFSTEVEPEKLRQMLHTRINMLEQQVTL